MRTRTDRLHIRLDDTERAALDLLAARWGATRSEVVRRLVLTTIQEPEPVETDDFGRDVQAWLAYAERTGTDLDRWPSIGELRARRLKLVPLTRLVGR